MVQRDLLVTPVPPLDALDDRIYQLQRDLDLDGLTLLHDALTARIQDVAEALAYVDDRKAGRDRSII